jgi:hypothetical protein
MVAAQQDDGSGDAAKKKSPIAFRADALLSHDALIHRWINDRLDASLANDWIRLTQVLLPASRVKWR